MTYFINRLASYMPEIIFIGIAILVITAFLSFAYSALILTNERKLIDAVYTVIFLIIFCAIGYLLFYFTGWNLVLCIGGILVLWLVEIFVISALIYTP